MDKYVPLLQLKDCSVTVPQTNVKFPVSHNDPHLQYYWQIVLPMISEDMIACEKTDVVISYF